MKMSLILSGGRFGGLIGGFFAGTLGWVGAKGSLSLSLLKGIVVALICSPGFKGDRFHYWTCFCIFCRGERANGRSGTW